MRLPQGCSLANATAQYGRYAGDEGPEADAFSMACWPHLATTGGFKAISQKWMDTLPALVCADSNVAKAEQQQEAEDNRPANYPAPCLLGSPFSFITWLDVLSGGSTMEVAYFWLTPGLAFTPLSGSALYIDVRLVTHCSDPCAVYNAAKYAIEGRYDEAEEWQPLFVAASPRQKDMLS